MKEKTKQHIEILKFFTKISLQIIILFVMAMAYSFITEQLQISGFFGDFYIEKPKNMDDIDPHFDWGIRHCLFFWMSLLLFLTQLARVIAFIIVEGEYTFNEKTN